MSVRSRCRVDDAVLDDLRSRLHNTRWPDAEVVDDWSQGVPLAYVQEVAGVLGRRVRLARSRGAPEPVRPVRDRDRWCRHPLRACQRSPHDDALPLVISHGWPGSIVEFHKVIEPLTNPTAFGGDAADAFHVVAPSLPGFGFSGRPTVVGWGVERIGAALAELMARLGYDRYVAQGGDWGSAITSVIGSTDPAHCAAIHLTLAMSSRPIRRSPRRPRSCTRSSAGSTTWNGTRGTPHSSALALRPSATGSVTRRPGSWRGSSRSSGRGPTATDTPSTRSAATRCSTT